MKDLGAVKEFLGIEIKRNRAARTLEITQSSYISKVLERVEMRSSKTASTPMALDFAKSSASSKSQPLPPNVPYRSAIGSLMYLMICTRPDISFAVYRLSQHKENPTYLHWNAVKRLLRYINGTRNVGLKYFPEDNIRLVGFADSDWAGFTDSRKSTEGYVFSLCGGAVSWKSKKETVVALSTCEAEYISICSATKEAVWLSRIVNDILGVKNTTPVPLHIENDGSIDLAKNETISQRTNHIDIRYHFIREALSDGRVSLHHAGSSDQAADPLTKSLAHPAHKKLCKTMGLTFHA